MAGRPAKQVRRVGRRCFGGAVGRLYVSTPRVRPPPIWCCERAMARRGSVRPSVRKAGPVRLRTTMSAP